MYTQCPECDVAFNVTAEVLKQAAGKVRCGGCGSAFNALDHLSEQMPNSKTAPADKKDIPELKPARSDNLAADESPMTISAEQSAALLKTLDELAGEDIRIEDTGVEWRVLDPEEDDEEDDEESESPAVVETGSMKFILQDDDSSESETDAHAEELRFDDNTPLPDDFDADAESAAPAKSAAPAEPESADDDAVEESEEPDSSQDDLGLGDPDEWEDLLDEADEGDETDSAEPDDEAQDTDTRSATPDDEPQDADTQSATPDDEPQDTDTQFAIQAEAMGIDLSGIHKTIDEDSSTSQGDDKDDDTNVVDLESTIEEDLIAAAFVTEAARSEDDTAVAEEDADEESDEDDDDAAKDEVELDLDEEEEEEEEIEAEQEDGSDDEAEDDADAQLEDALGEDTDVVYEEITTADDDDDGHVIPEQTEEEKTINMLIDQDLLALSIEDEDGFASTIVQKQTSIEDIPNELSAENPHVETIIMEGDFVRSELERESLAKKGEARPSMTGTTSFLSQAKMTMTSHIQSVRRDNSRSGMGTTIGVIALFIVLALQYVHQSRESLATGSVFNNYVGPIYRSFGSPVTPSWDVSGWRFEATKGSANEEEDVLTIYSRVGNKSSQPLPYPLVHISLTDRFEEIIGSRVLEPIEYLVGDPDPRKAVAPGGTFDVVIAIETPMISATGFKLNVCYRLDGGQLRCAIEDFK